MSHKHLKEHLPFITAMIESVKTMEFKQKWQNMKSLIEGNILTAEQIKTIELNIQKAKQLKEQYQKTIVTTSSDVNSAKITGIIKNVPNKSQNDNNKSSKTENNDANIKQQKELSRLYENIVKDDSPLPSKRRSALKRSYRDSLEFLLGPTRSQERKVKADTEKGQHLKKRKSLNDSEINTSNDDSIVSQKSLTALENVKMSRKSNDKCETKKATATITKSPRKGKETVDEMNTNKTVESIKEPTSSKLINKPVELKAKNNLEMINVESKKSTLDKLIKRNIQKQQKKDVLKKKSRVMLLTKGASFKKENVNDDDEWEDVDEGDDAEVNEMETNNDSTSNEEIKKVQIKMFTETIPKQESKAQNEGVVTKRKALVKINKDEDYDWEELNKSLKTDQKRMKIAVEEKLDKIDKLAKERNKVLNEKKDIAEIKSNQEVALKKVAEVKTKIAQPKPARNALSIVIKKVQNMSYIPCKSGFIFKCLVTSCKFQTMDNPSFVDHIENEHLTLKWEGECEICKGKVDKTRSIIFELMHMRENHLLKEQADPNQLPDIKEHFEKDEAIIENKIQESPSKIIEEKDEKSNKIQSEENKLEPMHQETQQKPLGSTAIVGKKIDIGKIKLRPLADLKEISPKLLIKSPTLLKRNLSDSLDTVSKSNLKLAATSSPLHKKSNITVPKLLDADIDNNEKDSVTEKLVDSPIDHKIVKHIIVKPAVESNEQIISQTNTEPKAALTVRKVKVKNTLDESANAKNEKQKQLESLKDMNPADLLRPWLKRKVKKYLMPTTRFLDNVAAIVATYKCMSSKCSFFTSDTKLYEMHLKFHENHQPGDRDYMNCAFCDHIFSDTDGIKALIEHLNTEHSYDKYQCKYCFYRSCVSLNVINHQRVYHAMKPKLIYELRNDKSRNYEDELVTIKKLRVKNVPPLVCVKCQAKFYMFPKLTAHMQTHGSSIKTKCIKCSEVSDLSNIHIHLIKCHKLGLYQCVYCNYGSNNFDTIVNHIGNLHASKPPIYCERSNESSEEINPSSIECTSLKFLTQQIDHRIIQSPKVNKELLRNEKNVGDLGGNTKVVQVTKSAANTETPSNSTNKIFTIGRVLHAKPASKNLDAVQQTPSTSRTISSKVIDQAFPKSSHVIRKVAVNSPEGSQEFVLQRVRIKSPKPTEKISEVKVVRRKVPVTQDPDTNKAANLGLQIKNVYSLNNSN